MRRLLACLMVVSVLLTAMVAHARTLGVVTPKSLGARNTVVARCDPTTSNWTFTYTQVFDQGLQKFFVTQVTVGNIASGCTGGVMSLTLTNSSGTSLGNGIATVSGGTAAVPISPQAQSDLVNGRFEAIVGP